MFEEYTTNSLREALRLLVHAYQLILAPENWTKEAWARDRKGKPVCVDQKDARSWCVVGAVLRAQTDLHGMTGLKTAKDQGTSEISAVLGPKRVVVALELSDASW